MDFGSPEDNTVVVKDLKDLYHFIGKTPPVKERKKLDYNSSYLFGGSRTNTSGSSNLSQGFQRKRIRCEDDNITTLSRNEKAEMIVAKSKVSKLENELDILKSEKKEREIQEEKLRKMNSLKLLKEQEKTESLFLQKNKLVQQQDEITEELKSVTTKYEQLKKQYEEDIHSLQSENSSLKKKINDRDLASVSTTASLNEKLNRQTKEMIVIQNSLKEAEAQLEIFKSRQKEVQTYMSNYNDLKNRCDTAEHQVKALEEKASRIDESSILMQKSQRELAKYRELEKENRKLKEDNTLFRDSADNALILHEKIEFLQSKLNKAERKIESLQNLEFENSRLKIKLEKWEANEVYMGLNNVPRSPGELTRMIAELQKSQLMMVEQQGDLETSIRSRDSMLLTKEQDLTKLHEVTVDLQSKTEQLEEKCQKLQRRLTLVSSDRDGLRRVLSSFEKEESNAQQKQMQEAEDAISRYLDHIKELEAQLEERKSKPTSVYPPLQLNQDGQKQMDEMKTELKKIQEDFNELKDEKDHLQIFYDKRQIQGEYDPVRTRVLALQCNPLKSAHEKHLEELKSVHIENEKLRKKIITLQQSQQDALDESINVSKLIKSSKPMEEAMKQVELEKLKTKRLEEQFSKKAKDFRTAVHELLGYSLKQTKDNTYRLQSIYSERQDDFFLFTCSKTKSGTCDTGIVETEYTSEWSSVIDDYLRNGESFPAFLAAVTLELFSRSTQIQDSTLAKRAKQI